MNELNEAKSEVLKLRAELRRTEEERDILKKAAPVLYETPRVKYRFIHEHCNEYRIRNLCRMLRVSRAGFYS